MSFSPSFDIKTEKEVKGELSREKTEFRKKINQKNTKECYLSDIDFIYLIIIGSNDLNPYVILENNLK